MPATALAPCAPETTLGDKIQGWQQDSEAVASSYTWRGRSNERLDRYLLKVFLGVRLSCYTRAHAST